MTEDTIAIIAPAVDMMIMEPRIHAAHVAVQDADRIEVSSREEAARRRLELGRLLVEARKAWPARGPNAKGWGDMLRRAGISEDSALRYMKLAGFVEESRTVREKVPSYTEAGIKSKARTKPDPEPELGATVSIAWKRDVSKALVGVGSAMMDLAQAWPTPTRNQLAATLESLAKRIRAMPDDSADDSDPRGTP